MYIFHTDTSIANRKSHNAWHRNHKVLVTCTVAFGSQASATKSCSRSVRPSPKTTRNEVMTRSTRPMASTASPSKTVSGWMRLKLTSAPIRPNRSGWKTVHKWPTYSDTVCTQYDAIITPMYTEAITYLVHISMAQMPSMTQMLSKQWKWYLVF